MMLLCLLSYFIINPWKLVFFFLRENIKDVEVDRKGGRKTLGGVGEEEIVIRTH